MLINVEDGATVAFFLRRDQAPNAEKIEVVIQKWMQKPILMRLDWDGWKCRFRYNSGHVFHFHYQVTTKDGELIKMLDPDLPALPSSPCEQSQFDLIGLKSKHSKIYPHYNSDGYSVLHT